MPSPTKLEAIVNMEKMLQRTPEQISSLWQEVRLAPITLQLCLVRHMHSIAICAAAPCKREQCGCAGKHRVESVLNKSQSMVDIAICLTATAMRC